MKNNLNVSSQDGFGYHIYRFYFGARGCYRIVVSLTSIGGFTFVAIWRIGAIGAVLVVMTTVTYSFWGLSFPRTLLAN